MNLVFEIQIAPIQKLVFLALADVANNNGESCFPGQKSLAEKSSCSLRTVQRSLDWLEENGYIVRQQRRRQDGYRTSDDYTIIVSRLYDTESHDRKSHDKLSHDSVTTSHDIHDNSQVTQSHVHIEEPSVRTISEPSDSSERKKSNPGRVEYSIEFLEFWKIYPPNRGSKPKSFESYQKSRKETDHATIIAGARNYAAECSRNGTEIKFIAHPTTWLNQKRWEVDYTTEIRPAPGAVTGRKSNFDDVLATAARIASREVSTELHQWEDILHG